MFRFFGRETAPLCERDTYPTLDLVTLNGMSIYDTIPRHACTSPLHIGWSCRPVQTLASPVLPTSHYPFTPPSLLPTTPVSYSLPPTLYPTPQDNIPSGEASVEEHGTQPSHLVVGSPVDEANVAEPLDLPTERPRKRKRNAVLPQKSASSPPSPPLQSGFAVFTSNMERCVPIPTIDGKAIGKMRSLRPEASVS